MLDQFYKYIDNVLSGQELVSETTKLTVLRHLNDMERSKGEDYQFYFDEKEAAKAITFLRALRHPSGDHGIAGERFNVQDNQAFITGCLFGWRDKGTKLRRFREVYFEVPRKWGKSLYAAFIQIYIGFYEGVKGAGIFTAATTREQADEVFRAAKSLCRYLIQDSPKAKKNIRVLANSIVDLKSECFIQKVSAEADNLDGKNAVCIVLDEKHAHKNDKIREVMLSGQATWKCPMLFTITTAGFNKEGPCFKVDRPNAIGVLKGDRKDERLFAMIFCHDTDDADGILNLDPDDPEQVKEILRLAKKSNPNLGSTPNHDFLLGRVREARNKGGSARVGVLTKNFNCWLDTPEIWIPEETVKAAMRPMSLEQFAGRPCYVGIDLAATKDITAAAFFFPAYGELPAAIITRFWLPEETVKKRQEDTQYLDWVHSGHIVTTPGNVADYQHIRNYLNEVHGIVNIQAVTIDQWNSVQISTDIQGDGFTIQLCRQSYGNLSEPSKWLEKAVLQGNVELNDNPVLLWMFRNVVLDYDANDNIKPNKEKSADKIDGVAASVMAIFGWITKPQEQTSYLLEEDADVLRL